MKTDSTSRDIDVRILELGADGLGLADREGKPLWVRNALPGETVTARILKRRKGRLFGDGLAVVENSHEMRVASACAYFPRCGGCSMHHVDYAHQLELKAQILRDALDAAGVTAQLWRAPVSRGRLQYRRKARLGVRQVGDQVLAGFRESFSNRVARIDTCQILVPHLAALLPGLRRALSHQSASHRIPQVELAAGDSGASLIVRHLEPLTPDDLVQWQRLQDETGAQLLLQPGGYDSVHGLNSAPIRLLDYQHQQVGVTMRFDPRQFTQVNQPINTALVAAVLSALEPVRSGAIVDMFCGIGNFSLPVARRGLQVYGFESQADAIDQARGNAQLNGLAERCDFAVADLYSDEAPPLPPNVSAMLLDPPRSGAGPHLDAWAAHDALQRIVYVSCNPATFATDAARLRSHGFALSEAGVYDMFPHTAHVETLGVFVRESRRASAG